MYADQQQKYLQNGHKNINTVKYFCRGLNLGHKLFDLRTGAFGLHNINVRTACQGQKREQKHENAHAAYPVSEASPKEHTLWQRLNVFKYARAGGCEAGHRLKKRIRY